MINDLTTASRHLPRYRQRSDHSHHQSSVIRIFFSTSFGAGSLLCDENHVKSNGTRCPFFTVNSAKVLSPSDLSGTSVRKLSVSGPATAVRPRYVFSTQGTTDP